MTEKTVFSSTSNLEVNEPPLQNPNPPENVTGGTGGDGGDDIVDEYLLQDPLLQSGTYIDGDATEEERIGSVETKSPVRSSDPAPAAAETTPAKMQTPSAAAETTPAKMQTPSAAETKPEKMKKTPSAEAATSQQKLKRSAEQMAERPSWLPENWTIELRTRGSGATAGTVDRYYFEPSGQKFRSKAEVLYFLETGSKRKKANTDGAATPSDTPKSQKQKKGGSKTKKMTAFYFDSENPPQSVCWVQTDSSADTWAPVTCNSSGIVPEPRKREWDAVFSSVSNLRRRAANV